METQVAVTSGKHSLAFVACIEAGVLESQALLLFNSIRRYGGEYSDLPIYAYSPRAGRAVSDEARRAMQELCVVHVEDELNTHGLAYGTVNRIVAASHAETHLDVQVLCVIDSDTFFVRPPAGLALPDGTDMRVRPVDVNNRCTGGEGDRHDPYWRSFCELCDVDYDRIPFVRTTVGNRRIKANYNGGLVLVRRDRGILRRAEDFFLASLSHDLAPAKRAKPLLTSTGVVSGDQPVWWGSSQVALSLAAWSLTDRIDHFDRRYNYPLHLHRRMSDDVRREIWPDVHHIHYHWLLHEQPEERSPLFEPQSPLASEQQDWLRAHCSVELS